VTLGGCGLVLDLDPPDQDRLMDAAAGDDDAGKTDAPAGFCGDGVVDSERGEECDEVSATCEDCRLVCDCPTISVPCLDRVECVEGSCEPRLLPEGTTCGRADGRTGTCRGSFCVPVGCGDGTVEADEECDDGNGTAGDGCEPDCVFSCHSDEECDDGDACNGAEICQDVDGSTGSACVPGASPPLGDCQVCTAEAGPHLPDEDGDGFPADRDQVCESRLLDCRDDDPSAFPGAPETCNAADDDCDGAIDEDIDTVTCGVDLDGDGYPGDSAGTTLTSCTGCPSGTTPVRIDSAGNPLIDCWDVADAFGPLVHPTQTEFFAEPYCAAGDPGCSLPHDYDCDGVEEPKDTRVGPNCDLLSLAGCRGDGWIAPVPDCGATGRFASCEPVLLLACRARTEDRRQACR
jgi:cysteine-rich repeat protein